jgi:hypothetical protein
VSAEAETLSFATATCGGGGTCSEGNAIDANYGSNAGVAVSYNNPSGATTSQLDWWDTDYSNLTDVAYGSDTGKSGTAEIFLQPLGGGSVTLTDFALGAWQNEDRPSQITIVNGIGTVLYSSGAITISGTTALQFSSLSSPLTSSDGIGIEWGPDAYDVGITNVDFAIGSTPLPSTWTMLIAGFLGVGFLAYRGSKKDSAALAAA